MTTRELKQRVKVTRIGYGMYRVSTRYRGKTYQATSHNSTAVDALDLEGYDPKRICPSRKAGLMELHREVLTRNYIV